MSDGAAAVTKRAARAARAQEKREKKNQATEQTRKQQQNEPCDSSCVWMPPEEEEGNVEYKLRLKDPSTTRLQQLVR